MDDELTDLYSQKKGRNWKAEIELENEYIWLQYSGCLAGVEGFVLQYVGAGGGVIRVYLILFRMVSKFLVGDRTHVSSIGDSESARDHLQGLIGVLR